MDDKDRELVAQVLRAAGTAGQEGFAAMVRYQWADGLTDVIGSLVAIAIIGILVTLAFRSKYDDDELRTIARIVSAVLGSFLFAIIFEAGLMGGVRTMMAPEGAAIHAVLHLHR